ncbi:hypothetical protein BJY52DRAFT_1261873 [Lactarius psammicola]|nr:hypothetical protein BJY52DRAFT_1282739 [Lactarius psammicola]KAI9461037.1 hypothetical protein BJY52DRAFT_1261873 [Lactarius psammicola]
MSYASYLKPGYFIFFVVIVVIAIIELAISAWLTSRYNSRHDFLSTTERDRVRFLLFCSIWTTVLSPIFPVLLFLESLEILASVAAHIIFLFVSWVFWLSGAAALTNALGGGLDCDLNFIYCGQLNALEAFAWIEWVFLTIGFVFVIVVAVRAGQRGEGYRGPVVSK